MGMMPNIAAANLESGTVNDSAKRLNEDSDVNEPKNKKSKAEKIDM